MKQLSEFPKLDLGVYPTPLSFLPTISARYGRRIWIKRDDLCGVALGGNKIRKLAFLLADAQAQGCDTVITTGSAQSNHAMLTAAYAAHLGMQCILLLKQRGVTDRRGNLVLNRIYGADVRFMDTDSYDEIYAEIDHISQELQQEGHKAYSIPLGGSIPLGSLGYVDCVQELSRQAEQKNLSIGHIVSATGSGGTTAGLLAGTRLCLPNARVTGIGVDHDPFESMVSNLTSGIATLLDCPLTERDDDFRMAYHVGTGYAIPNPEDTPFIEELARTEGILLDPVYTGKAWCGMLKLLQKGWFDGEDDLVFVHTGGAAALFAMDLPHT